MKPQYLLQHHPVQGREPQSSLEHSTSAGAFTSSLFGITYLAGFWTIRIKLNLFNGQFSSGISIITQIHSAKCTLTQQFTKSPVGWSSWCWKYKYVLVFKWACYSADREKLEYTENKFLKDYVFQQRRLCVLNLPI